MKTFIKLVVFLLSSNHLFGQIATNKCPAVKTGHFYFYPTRSYRKYEIIRSKFYQMEIDLVKHDTTIWEVSWMNDCRFDLKFSSKTGSLSKEDLDFYHAHIVSLQIEDIGDNFYAFKGALDSLNAKTIFHDTIWFHPK